MSVSTTREGSTLVVSLARPEVHNALDETTIAELTRVFETAGSDNTLRAVVLRAKGKSFCAGADLNWMRRTAAYTENENLADAQSLDRMFSTMDRCPKATIACIQGAALGGGAGLAAVCDVAIAAQDAYFAFGEVRLGLVPAVIAPYVTRKIGYGACRALFVTGRRISAQDARNIGLISEVTEIARLDDAVQATLRLVHEAGPSAIAATKRLLQDIDSVSLSGASDYTTRCIAAVRASPEGQEGIRAFLEKRTPGFLEEID